jgi:hypothetical protein
MARFRLLLIAIIAVAFAGVDAWHEPERAEPVVKVSRVPVTAAIASRWDLPIQTRFARSTLAKHLDRGAVGAF